MKDFDERTLRELRDVSVKLPNKQTHAAASARIFIINKHASSSSVSMSHNSLSCRSVFPFSNHFQMKLSGCMIKIKGTSSEIRQSLRRLLFSLEKGEMLSSVSTRGVCRASKIKFSNFPLYDVETSLNSDQDVLKPLKTFCVNLKNDFAIFNSKLRHFWRSSEALSRSFERELKWIPSQRIVNICFRSIQRENIDSLSRIKFWH